MFHDIFACFLPKLRYISAISLNYLIYPGKLCHNSGPNFQQSKSQSSQIIKLNFLLFYGSKFFGTFIQNENASMQTWKFLMRSPARCPILHALRRPELA